MVSENDLRDNGFLMFRELSQEAKETARMRMEQNPFTQELIQKHHGSEPWYYNHWFSADGNFYAGKI